MIKVYQIQLTDAEIAAVNSGETSDRIKTYFGRSLEDADGKLFRCASFGFEAI